MPQRGRTTIARITAKVRATARVKEPLKVSQSVEVKVNESARLQTRRHHSATHLLHAALRKFLGEHIAQAGSSVEPNRLRFDFSHPKPVTSEELEQMERFSLQTLMM